MSCRSPTWEKLTAACRAEQEKMIMVTNWDTSALVWKDWGKPEGREETQDSCQTSSQLIFCFLPVCWQTVIHLSVSLTDKHTWVVCEAVCIDVGDPVLQLRVLLHLSVSTVIHIQPADHKPAAHTHTNTQLISCDAWGRNPEIMEFISLFLKTLMLSWPGREKCDVDIKFLLQPRSQLHSSQHFSTKLTLLGSFIQKKGVWSFFFPFIFRYPFCYVKLVCFWTTSDRLLGKNCTDAETVQLVWSPGGGVFVTCAVRPRLSVRPGRSSSVAVCPHRGPPGHRGHTEIDNKSSLTPGTGEPVTPPDQS